MKMESGWLCGRDQIDGEVVGKRAKNRGENTASGSVFSLFSKSTDEPAVAVEPAILLKI